MLTRFNNVNNVLPYVFSALMKWINAYNVIKKLADSYLITNAFAKMGFIANTKIVEILIVYSVIILVKDVVVLAVVLAVSNLILEFIMLFLKFVIVLMDIMMT